MDEDLKAALAEAEDAVNAVMFRPVIRALMKGGPVRVPETQSRDMAAAAIAAFLHRMPWLHYEPEELSHGENMTGAELADAIERIAGEA